MTIPSEIQGKKYISLTSFRKNGQGVKTPLWFGESGGKLYVMTRNDSWKYKRIRNNPSVEVAPCTIRGAVTGPQFQGTARILPRNEWPHARKSITRKYWLARLPFWSKHNEFIEIEVRAGAVPKTI